MRSAKTEQTHSGVRRSTQETPQLERLPTGLYFGGTTCDPRIEGAGTRCTHWHSCGTSHVSRIPAVFEFTCGNGEKALGGRMTLPYGPCKSDQLDQIGRVF